MTAAGVIGLRARLRREDGVGLVELLIAMLVLNVGVFATIAAFTSGMVAIRNASHVSTAAAIADKQVETFRDTSYANITAFGPSNVTGADGRTYNVTVTVSTGSQKTGVTYPGSASVKVVTITVKDGAAGAGGRTLYTNASTYARCTQSGIGSDPTACQS